MTREEYIKQQLSVDPDKTKEERINEAMELSTKIAKEKLDKLSDHELDVVTDVLKNLKK